MIKSNYTTALAAGLVSVLSIGAVLPSGAQHGPRDYQRTALTAIKEGKWQEALDAVDRCIRVYEPRIKMLGLDDGFGWFYYQKGVCLAQLKHYKEAVEAFKACYTKFLSHTVSYTEKRFVTAQIVKKQKTTVQTKENSLEAS